MSGVFGGSYGGDGSKIADDTRLECGVCWWVYDPVLGDDFAHVPAGTPFRLLPDTWACPSCETEKAKFIVLGEADVSRTDDVQKLANAYRRAALNVKGLPIYNPALAVEAIGFQEYQGRQAGVIVTPWFVNLAVLPTEADRSSWRVGTTVRLAFPSGLYDFQVAELANVGLVATCPLFSSTSDFTDHEAAQLAAKSAAEGLFQAEAPPQPDPPGPAPTYSRRQLLGG
jgi:[NiFe] hydrogenase assembly HybE family chaperone